MLSYHRRLRTVLYVSLAQSFPRSKTAFSTYADCNGVIHDVNLVDVNGSFNRIYICLNEDNVRDSEIANYGMRNEALTRTVCNWKQVR